MKKLLYTSAIVISLFTLKGQTTTENYVKTTVPQVAVDNEIDLNSLPDVQKQVSVTYYDGLGRPVQSVVNKQSPAQKDVVQVVEYDAYGRKAKQYLPYVSTSNDLSFKANALLDQASFYQTKARVAHSNFPFSETVFESSPLNRALEQSAPGEDWQLGNGHTTKMSYSTNATNEVRLWIKNGSGEITTSGYYAAGELYASISEDEHGSKTYEYSDKNGNVVLRKVQHGSGASDYTFTSYVYDDFNRLIAVVPPQPYKDLQGPPGGPNPTDLNAGLYAADRIYTYKYDERGRVIEKKIPHKAVEYIVYDLLDRPVLTQDGNQRLNDEWYYTKYNILGRPIITGIYSKNIGRVSLQLTVTTDGQTNGVYEGRTASNFSTQFGYTNNVYPTSFTEVHTVTYYDDYDFNNNGSDDIYFTTPPVYTDISLAFKTTHTSRTRGMQTGSLIKVLDGGSTYLQTAQWYDEKGRLIQINSQNNLLGNDIVHNLYDFAGKVLLTSHAHTNFENSADLRQRFTYDHASRLVNTYHKIGTANEIILSANKYNELSQLIDKKVHSTNLTTPKYLQSIDYAYNIRGWLTHINNDDLDDDEYSNNVIDDGIVVGYQMNFMDYAIQEITPGEGEPGNPYLTLLISDESEMIVQGEVNTELYQNGESKLIKLIEAPTEGEDPLYNSLYTLISQSFNETYSPPYEIDANTTLEDLENWIYPDVEDALEGVSYTNPDGVNAIQVAVFNYIAGKAGQIMTPEQAEIFATPDITIYFEEQNGLNLYMRIDDVHSTLSFTPFIMSRTSSNQAEYDFLYDLTNPLDDPGNPSSNRTAQPLGISFDSPYLYEGIGTVEAVNICKQVAESALAGANITNTTIITRVNVFARLYAIERYGNQFFNDDANDLWGMEIKYNNPTKASGVSPFGTTALYNGNICETTWKGKGDEVKRGYGYQYDQLNRILSANYKAYDATAQSWTAELNRYNVSNISYDLNGNIQTLQRNGFTAGTIASPTFASMDNLTYTYNYGDQLMAVSDNTTHTLHLNDFVDGNTSGNDYVYDVNGNLTADYNKDVTLIAYNHLNLPTRIESSNDGAYVDYVYDGAGTKLYKEFFDGDKTYRTYYTAIGNYTENVSDAPGTLNLDFIFSPEGRIVDDNGTWRYEYYYKDHLGNTRLGFTDYDNDQEVDETEITQQSNYYPFGLEHKGDDWGVAAQTTHKYLYNGKELQEEIGLNWTDYGARNYDAAVGRWFSVDPAANLLESSSPYVYALNCVLIYVDKDGELPILINGFVASDGERADEIYWSVEILNTIKNSGIANPGGEMHFVDGDVGFGTVNGQEYVIHDSNKALYAVDRKRAGKIQAKGDFDKILGKLAKDPKTGKIIEKIQIYTHSRGAAFGGGYTEELMRLINENADLFENPNDVIDFVFNMAPHQSNWVSTVDGIDTYGMSHYADLLSGNDIDGATNFTSSEGGLQSAHGNASFVKDLSTFVNAFLSSGGDSKKLIKDFVKNMSEKYDIDVKVEYD